jgi:hypothetical protein
MTNRDVQDPVPVEYRRADPVALCPALSGVD